MNLSTSASRPKPLPISAVNHLGRVTKRVEASRDFYRDVLGFREVSAPNFNFPARGSTTTAS